MKTFETIGIVMCVGALVAILSLVLAFPFMWTWNYIMPTVFGLPIIDWLGAFCLLWISHQIFPSKVVSN
jgi:hypothetical protein